MRKLVLGLAGMIARFVEFFAGGSVGGDCAAYELLETELTGEDGTVIGRCVIMTHGKTSTIVDAWLEAPSRDLPGPSDATGTEGIRDTQN